MSRSALHTTPAGLLSNNRMSRSALHTTPARLLSNNRMSRSALHTTAARLLSNNRMMSRSTLHTTPARLLYLTHPPPPPPPPPRTKEAGAGWRMCTACHSSGGFSFTQADRLQRHANILLQANTTRTRRTYAPHAWSLKKRTPSPSTRMGKDVLWRMQFDTW